MEQENKNEENEEVEAQPEASGGHYGIHVEKKKPINVAHPDVTTAKDRIPNDADKPDEVKDIWPEDEAREFKD